MRYVRLMTFNVQLLPVVPVFNPNPGDEAENRAKRIVEAFQKLPSEELPDIVTFNECFNEDARHILIKGLEPLYAAHIAKFDDCNLGQDSGLAIYTRFGFMDIPGTGGAKFKFYSYPGGNSWDKAACKGVAVVRLETPIGILTLAFSHTQAAYDFEDQYRETRENQLADIGTTIANVNGNFPDLSWSKTIAMGDFNIVGNGIPVASPESEWFSEFEHPGRVFTDAFFDGWRQFNRPPGAPLELDPGFTNNNLEAGEDGRLPLGLLSRFDYICFSRLMTDQTFVAQHMRTRFRNLSDHFSLEADIHWVTPHCSPSDAIDGLAGPEFIPNLRIKQLNILYAGCYQWVYVNTGGTFTIIPPDGLETTLYSADNLSTAWNPYDTVKVADIGVDNINNALHQFGNPDARGDQYAMSGPFFIRVRGGVKNTDFTGFCFVGIFRHTGQNPQTAFNLLPWTDPFMPPLPLSQPNGPNDECWFRADIHNAYSGEAHLSTFFLENNTGNDIKGEFFKGGMISETTFSGAEPLIQIPYTTAGPETVYLKFRRSLLTDINFRAYWQSGLTWLRSMPNVRPMVLRCVDETGIDAFGDDEIWLALFADDQTTDFFTTTWDDADSDEMLKLEGSVPEIAFVRCVDVHTNEDDDILPSDPVSTRIDAMGPGDGITKSFVQSYGVQSGTYQFECSLSRWQQG